EASGGGEHLPARPPRRAHVPAAAPGSPSGPGAARMPRRRPWPPDRRVLAFAMASAASAAAGDAGADRCAEPEQGSQDVAEQFRLSAAGGTDPCSAQVLSTAWLMFPYGMGAKLNNYVNDLLVAMHRGQSFAVCVGPDGDLSLDPYFRDVGLPRCLHCKGPQLDLLDEFPVLMYGTISRRRTEEVKALLYQTLFQPTALLDSLVGDLAQTLGISSQRYVGVHVRRRDKWREAQPVPLEAYAHVATHLCGVVNATRVYLATDDPNGTEASLRALLGPGILGVGRAGRAARVARGTWRLHQRGSQLGG
ncbi:unnamed protein product, partial [Prorocentrum cordatum]